MKIIRYILILLISITFFPLISINADGAVTPPQINYRPSVANPYEGDHGFLTIAESGGYKFGSIESKHHVNFEWSLANQNEQTGYIYVSDNNIAASKLYIPSEEIFTLPGEEAGKHPCGWNDNGERGSDVYAHYFNDHHAPRDFMNGLIYDQKISSKALMSTLWYQKYYEGNENRNVSYFNQIDGFAFSDGNGPSQYTEYKQDYRSIIKFGTHNSECYSGIIYFTNFNEKDRANNESLIIAIDLKNINKNNELEIEYWVFYDPDIFSDVNQSIDEQIKNSPVYCDSERAKGATQWTGTINSGRVFADVYNSCLGLSFQFQPGEYNPGELAGNPGIPKVEIWHDGPRMLVNMPSTIDNVNLGMIFEPLNCTYDYKGQNFDLQKIAEKMNNRDYKSTDLQNYCNMQDYLLQDGIKENPLFNGFIDSSGTGKNDAIPYDFIIEDNNVYYMVAHTTSPTGEKGIDYKNFNKVQTIFCAICNQLNMIEVGAPLIEKKGTPAPRLSDILWFEGQTSSNLGHLWWVSFFYTETHKVTINLIMSDPVMARNTMSDAERRERWINFLDSMTLVPIQPLNSFNSDFYDPTTKELVYKWDKTNPKNSLASSKDVNVIEAIIDKPFDLATKASNIFSGNNKNGNEKLKEGINQRQEVVQERESQLEQLEMERIILEKQLANDKNDLESQRQLQILEYETRKAEMELEMERLKLDQQRQALESPDDMNNFRQKEFYNENDRGFFVKPEMGQLKEEGGFEDLTSNPTNLALLGLVITVGATALQLFRGN
jgi:hypothetical protein